MNLNLSPTLQHMLLDFGAAVLGGALLSVATYLAQPGDVDWKLMGASVITGAVLAGRKWLQQAQLPQPNPPVVVALKAPITPPPPAA